MLIKRGAEADIYLVEWYGRQAISKVRKRKQYMHEMLDREIRMRRTLHEAEMINMAKRAGVTTPLLYFVDPNNAEIIMQYIEGEVARDLIYQGVNVGWIAMMMGIYTARLHAKDIVHGDLTTSNFIVYNNATTSSNDNASADDAKRLVLIDFGLSFYSSRLEDKAVDIRLIKEVMSSAHADVFDELFNNFVQGYSSVVGNEYASRILKKVREIEKRGRYARVV
ncbi:MULTISPECIES: Kae1-associated kinase Bud32 [Candidatus Nitrosocaldus]|jgi:TP53 regulating kinase-like protein|uniref:non-specific serine/threonine protein kinase n=1 Tax=Candidatus Nitrosocaldus cavascurensis TaxID=2058097 RepID=A0A2K5AQF8_9ARCH|nr:MULTISPECIES: Kae1-associated kinase Bud32 [Candidatus Nitrosocaldus]SPC33898.1 Kae1-associated kinase Bud32 [Candidatus Nitrosocaldus cavascurensis]